MAKPSKSCYSQTIANQINVNENSISPDFRNQNLETCDFEKSLEKQICVWKGNPIRKKSPLKEMFTDSDNFIIEFGNRPWTAQNRATILAAAISIDFDFFENNNKD